MKQLLYRLLLLVVAFCAEQVHAQGVMRYSIDSNVLRMTPTCNGCFIKSTFYRIDNPVNNQFWDNKAIVYKDEVDFTHPFLAAGVYAMQLNAVTNLGDTLRAIDSLEVINLLVPDTIDVTTNDAFEIYFDNLVLTKNIERYHFVISTNLAGKQYANRWAFTPNSAAAGNYDCWIAVKNNNGRTLAAKKMVVRLVAPFNNNTKPQTPVNVLFLGHSLVYSSHRVSNKLAGLTSDYAQPFVFKGSVAGTVDNSRHEGWSGKTWDFFINDIGSPLFYNNRRDLTHYVEANCDGHLDYLLLYLDVNDYFSMNTASLSATDDKIQTIKPEIETLINSFKAEQPDVVIGLCLMIPPSKSDSAFAISYSEGFQQNRWRWQQIQHRVVETYQTDFGKRQAENIFLVPLYVDFDCVNQYPSNSALHPTTSGYYQIAQSAFAWLVQQTQSHKIFPVQLVSFKGAKEKDGKACNHLSWKTGSVQHAKTMALEKSGRGDGFKTIYTTEHVDNNIADSYDDCDYTEPVNTYRLKLTDSTGGVRYSKMITLQPEAADSILLYPNPARDFINIAAIDKTSKMKEVGVYDASGRLLYKSDVKDRSFTIPLQSFAPGLLTACIKLTDNSTISRKFIKW